jgi:hypothetical protein
VPSHSADPFSSHLAVSAPAIGDELAAGMPLMPGSFAAKSSDGLTTAAAHNFPATAHDADEVTGNAPSVSGAYIYGYDSAGNPTLADAGDYYYSSDHQPPPS